MKTGVALSGGGIESGFAAIGVLYQLAQSGIQLQPISVSGVSSLIACMLACGYTQQETIQIFTRFYNRFRVNADINKMRRNIKKIFRNKGIIKLSDMDFKIAINSVDILTGDTVVFLNRIEHKSAGDTYIIDDVNIENAIVASFGLTSSKNALKLNKRRLADQAIKQRYPISTLYLMGVQNVLSIFMDQRGIRNGSVLMSLAGISSGACFVPVIKPDITITISDKALDDEYVESVKEMVRSKMDDIYDALYF